MQIKTVDKHDIKLDRSAKIISSNSYLLVDALLVDATS